MLKKVKRVVTWAACMLLPCSLLSEEPDRVELAEFYRARRFQMLAQDLDVATEKLGAPWEFTDNKGPLTGQSEGVRDLAVESGVVQFTAAADSVTLDLGNVRNQQDEEERVPYWPGWNFVEILARQSADESEWTVQLWQDGRPKVRGWKRNQSGQTRDEETLTGKEWQTLSFPVMMPQPDGFTLTIRGPAGNRIEIDSVRVIRKRRYGCFLREFTMPSGVHVWSAVAEVGRKGHVFLNGKELPVAPYLNQRYLTAPVNLAPHIKRGRNLLVVWFNQDLRGLDLKLLGSPQRGYVQGRVNFSNGEIVSLDAPDGWLVAGEVDPEEASRTGLSSAAWQQAEASPHLRETHFWYRYPAYDGRLRFVNPGQDPKLFFDDDKPLQIEVDLPEGLAQPGMEVHWTLRRIRELPKLRTRVAHGIVKTFKRRRADHSVVGVIDTGIRSRGVYTLDAGLMKDGEVLERRLEEPLIVVGNLPMGPEVDGREYEEGMDLVLEDAIDFTDPEDPHDWVEVDRIKKGGVVTGIAEPRVVTRNGLTYRETTGFGSSAGVSTHFSYRFAFQQPGQFYLLVLDYPNDADRGIGAGVIPVKQMGSMGPRRVLQTGPAVVTGFHYPLTDSMEQLKWIHYAQSAESIVSVAALGKGMRGAAARLRIYRVGETLPELKVNPSGERWTGIHTERARNVALFFGPDAPSAYLHPYQGALGLDLVESVGQRLRWQLIGMENYTKYLRFTGQNLHVMGSYQYSEDNNSYYPPAPFPSSHIPCRDLRETAVRIFEKNGIRSYSLIEYSYHRSIAEREEFQASDDEVRRGADTVFAVSKDGRQAGGYANVSAMNLNHPAVTEGYMTVIRDLAKKFSFAPSWKGVYVVNCPGFSGTAAFAPHKAPFDYDYSDATILKFEADTGIDVPGEARDPNRFQQRYTFLTSGAMREAWIDWRCRNTVEVLTRTRDLLREWRPDLEVPSGYYIFFEHMEPWLESGREYRDFIRDYSIDPVMHRDVPGVWLGRLMWPNDAMRHLQGVHGYARLWQHHVNPEVLAAYEQERNRLVVMGTWWHETQWIAPGCSTSEHEPKPPAPPDWPVSYATARYVSQAGGESAREKFAQALIGADPELLLYGFTDMMMPLGHEQELREFLRVFTALPGVRFEDVNDTADFKHNLAIRSHRDGEWTWFYVVNPGYWRVKGELVLECGERVLDAVSGEAVGRQDARGQRTVPVSLDGYGMAAFKVRSRRAAVIDWSIKPLEAGELAHMRRMMRETRHLLAEPFADKVLDAGERTRVTTTLTQTEQAIAAGEYARAWSMLTGWRFWTLCREDLKQAAQHPDKVLEPAAEVKAPDLRAVKATGTVMLDGRAQEPFWASAPVAADFYSLATDGTVQGKSTYRNGVRVAHDSTHLYLFLELSDPAPAKLQKSALVPGDMYNEYDDCVTVFLWAGPGRLLQLAINPAGMRLTADATGAERGCREHDPSLTPDWAAAVRTGADGWQVEMAVPFNLLGASAPGDGDVWRMNVLRRFRHFDVAEMYWARINKGWYEVDRYGKVRF